MIDSVIHSLAQNERYDQLTAVLDNCHPIDWDDIIILLSQIKNKKHPPSRLCDENHLKCFAKGTAFITFSYGIDGVSIEATKYAQALNDLFNPVATPSIHMIGGNFEPQAAAILNPNWHQFQIDGIDGWNKWDDGIWFNALFRNEMRFCGQESYRLADQIYKQAVLIAKHLGKYLLDNQISLVVPVNVASNPGNIALTLGLVFATEILGIYVLNSNHDFYWESGKPLSKRYDGQKPGVRDHFFRNIENKPFFSLFKLLYPWNGNKWLQTNINARQSNRLMDEFGFSAKRVGQVSTCLADTFFQTCSKKEVRHIRLKMAHILSDGQTIMHPVPLDTHLSNVDRWMKNQQPIILGARSGLSIDPSSNALIIMLQPTRIVGRKRIARNFDLLSALFQESAFKEAFENNPKRQLILHITGPTPKEHQKDLEKVLFAYKKTIQTLPKAINERIFLAFSVGQEYHTSFSKKQYTPLTIENIYQMADVVLFPSETEGRGLPIIEASASGIPIICSQYHPIEVFNDVIGEELSAELQIHYTLFPEGELSQSFLSEVADLLIHPDSQQKYMTQNRKAVQIRHSYQSFKSEFAQLLKRLYALGQGV